jgi:hypothetical protein
MNVGVEESAEICEEVISPSEHTTGNVFPKPRNNYQLKNECKGRNHASEMNEMLVKYAGNLMASRLVLRLFLSRIGSMMTQAVMYVANTSRMTPNTKGGKKGEATKRLSESKIGWVIPNHP